VYEYAKLVAVQTYNKSGYNKYLVHWKNLDLTDQPSTWVF